MCRHLHLCLNIKKSKFYEMKISITCLLQGKGFCLVSYSASTETSVEGNEYDIYKQKECKNKMNF